jgi:hypothetical protein
MGIHLTSAADCRVQNNDPGRWFIYEFERPVSARYLKFTLLDKFPDDGYAWTLNRLEFDELRAGRLMPQLRTGL